MSNMPIFQRIHIQKKKIEQEYKGICTTQLLNHV